MGMILRDWNIDRKRRLNRSAYEALPSAGALVAVESLIDDDRQSFGTLKSATMKHMATEVGIRALKQNASAVVAQAAAGTTVTITDHGRPVARLVPIPATELEGLTAAGQARPARRRMRDLAPPEKGPVLSEVLREQRDAERY